MPAVYGMSQRERKRKQRDTIRKCLGDESLVEEIQRYQFK